MTNAPGPRATPLVVGNLLYAAGATGKLHCLDKRSGKVVWSHDLFNEYKGYVQDEYYAASPLAYKNTIIVPVGAAGASIVAFDQKTGAVVWKKQDFKTSYASPILIKVDGQEQVVLMMESEIVGVEPNTGELLWSHPVLRQNSIHLYFQQLRLSFSQPKIFEIKIDPSVEDRLSAALGTFQKADRLLLR